MARKKTAKPVSESAGVPAPASALPSPPAGVKRHRLSYERRKQIAGFIFVLPWILGFLLFIAYPIYESLTFAFKDIRVSPGTGKLSGDFVGFDNFIMVLVRDQRFPPMLLNSLISMVDVLIIPVFSLIVAFVLNQKFRGRTIYRAIFFLPVIITSGVVFVMMNSVVGGTSADSATNSYMFQSSGLKDILQNAGVATSLISMITGIVDKIFSLVMRSGVQILLFLSGLQKIPQSSYEAARVEGANSWDCFWKITLPRISPMILVTIIYTIVDTFTQYGAEISEKVVGNQVMYEIMRVGFRQDQQYSMAAAMAWSYFTMVLLIIGLVYLIIGRPVSKLDD